MASLVWNFGTMNSGKSTLALQLHDTYRRGGRTGVLFTRGDRSGQPRITSRLGIEEAAIEVSDDLDIAQVVLSRLGLRDPGRPELPHLVSFVIADEVQFYSAAQVDQLAWIVDQLRIDVHAFGLATDFTSTLFPGSARMFELADVHLPLPVQALCWCGQPGKMNARIVAGQMVTEGAQVLVGDVEGAGDEVAYRVLCRAHYMIGAAAPAVPVR